MEPLKHECGVAMIRLLKPLEYYQEKYGTWMYGLNKLYLLMEKQHNRGQEAAGLACVKLQANPGEEYMFRERGLGSGAITETFSTVHGCFKDLTQEQLRRTLMPVGEYEKPQIRRIAEEAGLPVAHKSDSQDICFVPDHDYASFIENETGKTYEPGNFVDESGNILGRHKGLIHYTIGQRKGLGITAATPLFVKELRPATNEVVISTNESLFSDTCYISDINYMAQEHITPGTRSIGKVRYSHRGADCTLTPMENGMIKCVFDEPQRAMTPGQAAVFYQDGHVLCGGTIEKMMVN